MAVFTYSGRGTGGTMTGEIEAPDRTSAVGELRKRAILVTKIQERSGGKSPSKAGGKVKDKEMAIFTRQFSTMIDAGLPLVQCLNILAEQSESKNLRVVTDRVARSVEQGSTLADSLRRHPRTFDDLFTNMVEVGESGGILDVVFQRLAAYIEKAAALKRKVKGAMIYPASIMGVAALVVIFMLTFVIPTFTKMFRTWAPISLCPPRSWCGSRISCARTSSSSSQPSSGASSPSAPITGPRRGSPPSTPSCSRYP